MPSMEFDRQAIERRDFPISRRGYDPATVDVHLRAIAEEFDTMQRTAAGGGTEMSVASSAGTHVHSILQAAETAAAEIERHALENARQVREDADRDAERTREEAVERARQHVAGVAQVTAKLLEHVGSMDGEVNALVESLRAGAGRLAADLSAVETGMGELYDSASGKAADADAPAPQQPQAAPPVEPEAGRQFSAELSEAMAAPTPAPVPVGAQAGGGAESGDVDGARLIALNMALNGESRADTERYLAENFELPDRLKLIDEVYSAIEG
jgi:vacuolar-type H+-ATPase subunit H